eukprot:5252-Lingulodinium_polyedra.AAC.1
MCRARLRSRRLFAGVLPATRIGALRLKSCARLVHRGSSPPQVLLDAVLGSSHSKSRFTGSNIR